MSPAYATGNMKGSNNGLDQSAKISRLTRQIYSLILPKSRRTHHRYSRRSQNSKQAYQIKAAMVLILSCKDISTALLATQKAHLVVDLLRILRMNPQNHRPSKKSSLSLTTTLHYILQHLLLLNKALILPRRLTGQGPLANL